MKTRIINCRLIDAEHDCTGSVVLSDGRIERILYGDDVSAETEATVIDAKGYAVMPAFIDLHAHFRTPGYEYKEDFQSGFAAALKGGYATVCAMANTDPVIDNKDILLQNITKANALNQVHFIQIGALGHDLEDKIPVDFEAMRPLTPLFSNDGKTVWNEQLMSDCLRRSSILNFTICTHCQPETEIIRRDLGLLKANGGNLHMCHVSTRESIDAIRQAKQDGLRFSCEVTPHHLFASELDYRVHPPFGTEDDRQSLIEGVSDGTIDVLATDHAPHSREDKENGSPGVDNIETAFQMYWHIFRANGISVRKFSEMASQKPAQMLQLSKGLLKEGYDADLVIVDLDRASVIEADDFASKSNNTPFDGYAVSGEIIKTMVDGEIRYDCGKTI